MDEITNYLNDPQLSEFLNDEEIEDPNPSSLKDKKQSFQAVVREVVMCHMREIEDVKGNYKKGVDVLVKRYKAVKDEKLRLKSKVEYWSEECKKLQFENSKLLSFLKNGLCTKCENQMKMVCGNYDFYRQSKHSNSAEKAEQGHLTSRSDNSAEEVNLSTNEEGHVTSDDHVISSDGHGTDDTSPMNGSKNRKLKLNRRSKRCRYAATSVKLRKSSSSSHQNESLNSKKDSKRSSGTSIGSPTKGLSKVSPAKTSRSSSRPSEVADLESSFMKKGSKSFDLHKCSSDDDLVRESPKLKRLKKSKDSVSLVSPRLSKLKLTKEADKVFKRGFKIMRYKGKSAQNAKSPSLFDEGHELFIEDDVIVDSPAKPKTRSSVRDNLVKEDKNLHCVSVQSTPSPSVLSGHIPKFNIDQRKTGESSPKLKSRDTKQKDMAIEIDLENAGSPSSSKRKKLVQTKITHEMFMPTKTYLPNVDEFNNGVLTPSKCDKETKDLQEAIKKSLDENSKKTDKSGPSSLQPSENSCMESVSAFSVPPLTSTPFVKDLEHNETFKKPQIPKKVPTTPKSKHLTSSPRRSPRLNKYNGAHRDGEISENCDSPANVDTPPHAAKNRQLKSRRNLEMDLPKKEVSVSFLSKANGSIDPQVHLSLYETAPDDYNEERSSQPASSQEKGSKSRLYEAQSSVDSDSLDLTCQSVVFGPPKVKNTKSNISEIAFDAGVLNESPEKVIYIPETMDVDLDSDYEDAPDIINDMEDPRVTSHEHFAKDKESLEVGDPETPARIESSFDYVPKDEGPNYAYADVVRKKKEREQLKSYTCKECEAYFNADGAAGDNLKFCRHKARYVPPSTPEHFWDMTLPDTQVAQERGYMNITQGKASKYRRKRKLNKLFKSRGESGSEENEYND